VPDASALTAVFLAAFCLSFLGPHAVALFTGAALRIVKSLAE
jgi:hypothetical protein